MPPPAALSPQRPTWPTPGTGCRRCGAPGPPLPEPWSPHPHPPQPGRRTSNPASRQLGSFSRLCGSRLPRAAPGCPGCHHTPPQPAWPTPHSAATSAHLAWPCISPRIGAPTWVCVLTSKVTWSIPGNTKRSTASTSSTPCPPSHRSRCSCGQVKSPTCGTACPWLPAAAWEAARRRRLRLLPPLPAVPSPPASCSKCASSLACSTTSWPSLVRATSTSTHRAPPASAAANAAAVLGGAAVAAPPCAHTRGAGRPQNSRDGCSCRSCSSRSTSRRASSEAASSERSCGAQR